MIVRYVLIIGLSVIFGYIGCHIPFTDQKEILVALSTSSSIIFAILGIWLAILYPDNFSSFIKKEKKHLETDLIFQKLNLSLVLTTIILISIIFSNLIIYIFKNIEFFRDYKYLLRGFFFAYLSSISILQAYAILTTLIPSNYFYYFSRKEKQQYKFAKRNGPLKKESLSVDD